ncbi:MAG: hypothetical protein EOQ56_35890 [Mesorhizobium sp.]|nr:MAG: hypothetical protein EOQ56_35890 [Mesorhizobium sp.]
MATLLDAVADPLEASVAPWLLSAGGGNVDVLAATKAIIAREPRQVGILCGRTPARLDAMGELQHWRKALKLFRSRLQSAIFGAVVLDYDGTIVDTRNPFNLARQDVTSELARILGLGCHLAIATGRGVSVRKDLRVRLSADLCPRVSSDTPTALRSRRWMMMVYPTARKGPVKR